MAAKVIRPATNLRELSARITSWWWIVGLLGMALVLGRTASVVFFAFVSFLAFREFLSIVSPRKSDRGVLIGVYLAIILQYYWVYSQWYGVFIIFIPVYVFLLLPLRMVFAGEPQGFIRTTATLHWGLMTTVFSLSHAAYLFALSPVSDPRVASHWPSEQAVQSPGIGLVILLLLLTEMNDVAQFAWGKLLGKNRIAPKVSPNKTVAGFVGGLGTTILLAGLVGPQLTPMNWTFSLLAGAIVGLSGFAGDLCISMLKRDLGVKDTGSVLPGHGGILDRVDSLTYSAPLYFHYVYYLYF